MKTRREDAEKTTTTNGNEADNFVSLGWVEGIGTGECRYRVRDRKRGVYVLLLLLLNMQDEEDEREVCILLCTLRCTYIVTSGSDHGHASEIGGVKQSEGNIKIAI